MPVIARELRVVARRPRTFRIRVLSALATLVLGAYFSWAFSAFSGLGAGRHVFSLLVQLAFVYCLFGGAGMAADSLSWEKRQGTMGILFLTQLRSRDIVFGKLAATSLDLIYILGAAVPILGLCLAVGGVQFAEFGRTVLALFNTLLLSLAVGLLVSAASREERSATQTAAGIMVILGYILPALGEYLRVKTNAIELGIVLTTISPLQTITTASSATGATTFWRSLLAVHLLAWAALAVACYILPRSWQDPAPGPVSVSWREQVRQHFARTREDAARFRQQGLECNPFYWLTARTGVLAVETWVLVGAIVFLTCWAGFWFRASVPLFFIMLMAAVALHTVMKMQICAAACDRIAQDKQTGALETLLATPLSTGEIVRGHWLALRRSFTLPIAVTLALDLVMLLIALHRQDEDVFKEPHAIRNWVVFFAAGGVMLVTDVIALGWMGMWQAVAASNGRQARSRSLLFILVIPWIVMAVVISLVAARQPSGVGALLLLAVWFCLGMGNSLLFAFWPRRKLLRDFRRFVTERVPAVTEGKAP